MKLGETGYRKHLRAVDPTRIIGIDHGIWDNNNCLLILVNKNK